jgi:hypothetical protein
MYRILLFIMDITLLSLNLTLIILYRMKTDKELFLFHSALNPLFQFLSLSQLLI